jgi:hypothetical protein
VAPAKPMPNSTEELVTELRVVFARMEMKLESILAEAQKTNGRVTRLETDEGIEKRLAKLEGVYQYVLGGVAAAFTIGTLFGLLLRLVLQLRG